MIFRQLMHEDLGCASYLVGDERAGVAAVVDPRLEVDEYLELARYLGVRIEHVFETHNHADHVSGHGRLAAATGATVHVHRLAAPDYAHEPFEDGDRWQLGCLRIEARHTPGHRPEHTCFALIDTRRGPEPWAILTGDSLFVGDVARPDLAVERTEGARGIFRSLHERLLELPDYVEVWPGHVGGSMCGGPGMDLKVSSTIGFERAHNPMLAIDDEAEFVTAAVANLGAQPPNFEAIVALNRGPLINEGVQPPRLFPGELDRRLGVGALVVDVRSDLQFDQGHIPAAVSIPRYRGGFGTKLAWLAVDAPAIVFVGGDDVDGQRAAGLAAAVGLAEPVRRGGLLAGGWTSWALEGRPRQTVARLSVRELDPSAGTVLDVREHAEFEAGHIPGSINAPWHDITALPAGLDPRVPIFVICASGQRAGTAASLLQRHGATDVTHIVGGGVQDWRALRL